MEINWQDLFKVLGMVLVVEGLMPFIVPDRWRNMMVKITSQNNSSLRSMGFFSMIVGLIIISII